MDVAAVWAALRDDGGRACCEADLPPHHNSAHPMGGIVSCLSASLVHQWVLTAQALATGAKDALAADPSASGYF